MITAEKLSFSYGARRAVDSVSLQTTPGQVLGVVGPNGSGKTTLLRMLYGSLTADAGSVHVGDTALSTLTPRQIAQQIAVVLQEEPDSGLLAQLTVEEMVLLGRTPHHRLFASSRARDHQIAAAALARVGLAHEGERPVDELSGGERRRVLIARALAQESPYLLLDEPTNHLDIKFQHEVLSLVRGLGITTIMVLHDLNLAAHYCDQILLLDRGTVVAAGTPDAVLTPTIIERVYGIATRRVDHEHQFHLLFQPLPTSAGDGDDVDIRASASGPAQIDPGIGAPRANQ